MHSTRRDYFLLRIDFFSVLFSVLFNVYYSIKEDNVKRMCKIPYRGECVEAYCNGANI